MATAIGILLIVFAFIVLIVTIQGMRDPKSYGNKDMTSSQILKTNSIIIIVLLSVSVMLQIKLDFCGSLISYKLGSDKGGVHVEEA